MTKSTQTVSDFGTKPKVLHVLPGPWPQVQYALPFGEAEEVHAMGKSARAETNVRPAGPPVTGKWCLQWRTHVMPAPSFFYFDTEKEAREAEALILRGSDLPLSVETAEEKVERALAHLRIARELLVAAGSRRSVERVRAAISSAKGALRHASLAEFREARQREKAQK